MKATCRFALLLTFVFAGAVRGDRDLESVMPLYTTANIAAFLIKSDVKKELKITKQQEKAITAILAKSAEKTGQDASTIYKMSGPDKDVKVRALGTSRADELFQALGRTLSPGQVKRLRQLLLQHWGIALFDFPEIRDTLNLTQGQAATLKSIYERLRNEIAKKAADRRISREEAQKQYNLLSFSVPELVRAALNEEQKKKLQELLGEPYQFSVFQ
jgi:hypothetical protein